MFARLLGAVAWSGRLRSTSQRKTAERPKMTTRTGMPLQAATAGQARELGELGATAVKVKLQ